MKNIKKYQFAMVIIMMTYSISFCQNPRYSVKLDTSQIRIYPLNEEKFCMSTKQFFKNYSYSKNIKFDNFGKVLLHFELLIDREGRLKRNHFINANSFLEKDIMNTFSKKVLNKQIWNTSFTKDASCFNRKYNYMLIYMGIILSESGDLEVGMFSRVCQDVNYEICR